MGFVVSVCVNRRSEEPISTHDTRNFSVSPVTPFCNAMPCGIRTKKMKIEHHVKNVLKCVEVALCGVATRRGGDKRKTRLRDNAKR